MPSAWKTCWPSMNRPMIRPNPWFASTKSPSCFIRINAAAAPPRQGNLPSAITIQTAWHCQCLLRRRTIAGRHFTWPTPNRSGAEFAKVPQRLAGAYPAARAIHLEQCSRERDCSTQRRPATWTIPQGLLAASRFSCQAILWPNASVVTARSPEPSPWLAWHRRPAAWWRKILTYRSELPPARPHAPVLDRTP